MEVIISPSLLSADFINLQKDIDMINRSEADWLHLDIMDGMFVPNISFGFPVISAVTKACKKTLDAHFMIEHPEYYIAQTAKLGVEIMCVHYEACVHLHRTIQEIHAAGMKAGMALNPSTPVSVLEDILDDLDLVLIMSVNPGFGGQKFIPNALKKVAQLRQEIDKRNLSTIIEVDGGVQGENAQALVDAGADALVSGSYIFNSTNPEETIRSLKQVKR